MLQQSTSLSLHGRRLYRGNDRVRRRRRRLLPHMNAQQEDKGLDYDRDSGGGEGTFKARSAKESLNKALKGLFKGLKGPPINKGLLSGNNLGAVVAEQHVRRIHSPISLKPITNGAVKGQRRLGSHEPVREGHLNVDNSGGLFRSIWQQGNGKDYVTEKKKNNGGRRRKLAHFFDKG